MQLYYGPNIYTISFVDNYIFATNINHKWWIENKSLFLGSNLVKIQENNVYIHPSLFPEFMDWFVKGWGKDIINALVYPIPLRNNTLRQAGFIFVSIKPSFTGAFVKIYWNQVPNVNMNNHIKKPIDKYSISHIFSANKFIRVGCLLKKQLQILGLRGQCGVFIHWSIFNYFIYHVQNTCIASFYK